MPYEIASLCILYMHIFLTGPIFPWSIDVWSIDCGPVGEYGDKKR